MKVYRPRMNIGETVTIRISRNADIHSRISGNDKMVKGVDKFIS